MRIQGGEFRSPGPLGVGADASGVHGLPPLPFPKTSQIESGLRELRCHSGSALYRVLYRRSGNLLVLLHILRKDTRPSRGETSNWPDGAGGISGPRWTHREEAESTEEWISPIGQSFDDYIAEQERLDPEYKRERERKRPRRELSRMLSIRRIELDLSQQDLAERMGTTVAVISRLERGTQNFSPATLQRLAEALDTRLTFTFEPKDGTKFEYVDDFVVVP